MSPRRVIPFACWPEDIAYQIIRCAAIPDFYANGNPYKTALALTRVSSTVRRMAMPAFLHTVLLNDPDKLLLLIQAVHNSRMNGRRYRRLTLSSDYTHLIRRLWITDAPARLVELDTLDHQTLYDIMRNVHSLGLTFTSLSMLSDCLDQARDVKKEWKCKRLTLCGEADRWRPLTATAAGVAFLAKITHLFVISVKDTESTLYPQSITNVPFANMPSLTHFAFPKLDSKDRMVPVVVYETGGLVESKTFRQWVTSPDPGRFGTLVPYYAPMKDWKRGKWFNQCDAYGLAEEEQLWSRAVSQRMRRTQRTR
ncbi:hypothetical protein ONZ45_g8010 [Pleurotus djamor]|nr:hypothetical protein ONZ45_g8010 [Pleurotus djamor]